VARNTTPQPLTLAPIAMLLRLPCTRSLADSTRAGGLRRFWPWRPAYADLAAESGTAPACRSRRLTVPLATELCFGDPPARRLDAGSTSSQRCRPERQAPNLRWLLQPRSTACRPPERVPASAAVTPPGTGQTDVWARPAAGVNGVLRAFLRRRAPLPAAPYSLHADRRGPVCPTPAQTAWLPDLLQWLPPEGAERFGVAANCRPSLDLRVNRCRQAVRRCSAAFAAAGVPLEPLLSQPGA